MTVPRIQPSATYVQDELSRIQNNLANAIDTPSSAMNPVPMYMGGINGAIGTGSTTFFQTGNNAGAFVVTPPFAGSIVGISIDLRSTSAAFIMPVFLVIGSTTNNVGTWNSAVSGTFAQTFRANQYSFPANTALGCPFGPPSATLSSVVATCTWFVTLNAS